MGGALAVQRFCPQFLRSVVIPSNTGAVTSSFQLLEFKAFPGKGEVIPAEASSPLQ